MTDDQNRKMEEKTMEEMKKIDNEALEKVDGGAAGLEVARKEVMVGIPVEVQGKIRAARSDAEARRILAENGIDAEKLEKKIAAAGVNPITLSKLPDEALDKVAGGFEVRGAEIRCECGNDNREDFSYQFWASSFSAGEKYRCKKCYRYMRIKNLYSNEPVEIEYYD